MSPCTRIDSASPETASWSNSLRGWRGLAWICSTGTCASSGSPLPIRTSKPRPRPRLALPALDKLHRHLPVGLGAARAPVEVGHGEAVARRLGDAYGPRHDRLEHEVA